MTRRVQFQRSSVTGSVPPTLQAGTPAFNWPDQKMYVGGSGDVPEFVIQRIDDWSMSLVYRSGDFVIYQDDIYRALIDISSGRQFNSDQWLQLTNSSGNTGYTPSDTGVFSGGETSQIDSRTIQVAAGTGVITDTTDPSLIVVTLVEWGDFTATYSSSGSSTLPTMVMGIDMTGAVGFSSKRSSLTNRNSIILCGGYVDTDTGDLTSIFDYRWSASQAADTLADFEQYILSPTIYRGGLINPNSDLTVSISEGDLIARNASTSAEATSLRTFPAADPLTWDGLYTGRSSDLISQTSIPLQWDSGGILTALTSSEATIHILSVDHRGNFFITIGQSTYSGVSQALIELQNYSFSEYTELSLSSVPVAAIVVTGDSTDLTDTTTSRVVRAVQIRMPFEVIADNDLSAYYRLDGSSPLAGDMDAALFAITNADLDGEAGTLIRPQNADTTGVDPAYQSPRTISTNFGDRKIFQDDPDGGGENDAIADRTEVFDATRLYNDGDTCYEGNVLYLNDSGADIPAGPFDPNDWQAIGSESDISDAVILKPISVGRNKIDLSGNPSVDGLSIVADPSQTENLADFGGAIIDQYGMPVGNFGGLVRNVAQANHGFTAVGQAIAFDDPNWVLADASNTTTGGKALGIYIGQLNANNFYLQTGGTPVGLEASAFAGGGGAMITGEAYYVSATVAGQLTTTVPSSPNRVDPVLVLTEKTGTGAATLGAGVLGLTTGGITEDVASGATSFQVTQTAHGFTNVGTPVTYGTNGLWTSAIASDVEKLGVGLVQEIIDVNNFVVNIAGTLSNISASVFENGIAPSAGVRYYVSQTTEGILTATPPAYNENNNLIFEGTSSTTGLVLSYAPHPAYVGAAGDQTMEGDLNVIEGRVNVTRTSDGGTAQMRLRSGGTNTSSYAFWDSVGATYRGMMYMTGGGGFGVGNISVATQDLIGSWRFKTNPLVENEGPALRLRETDQVTSANGFRVGMSDGNLAFITENSANATVTVPFRMYRDGALTANDAVVTLGSADGRYLQLSGGTLTGPLTDTGGNITVDRTGSPASTGAYFITKPNATGGQGLQMYNWVAGTSNTLVYLTAAADMGVGGLENASQTLVGSWRTSSIFNADGGLYVRSDAPSVRLQETDFSSGAGWMMFGSSGALNYATTDANANFIATIGSLARDGSANSSVSILTRGAADERYLNTQTVTFSTIGTGTTAVTGHSLGVVPTEMTAFLVCKVAEGGYVVGERVSMPTSYGVGSTGEPANMIVTVNSTTVRATYGSAYNQLPSRNTGSRIVLTNANWSLEVTVRA